MQRIAMAVVVGTIVGIAPACGSKGSGSSGTDEAGSSPCGDYYDAIHADPCGTGPTLPASETTRLRARFEQVCEDALALPGSGMTADSLEACATALASAGCAAPGTTFPACAVTGTLPAGTACDEDFQCTSGACFQSATPGEAGPSTTTCGQCLAIADVGQPCTAVCTAGATCDHGETPPTCVTLTQGGASATCDDVTQVCYAGLYCGTSGTCTPYPTEGQACGAAGCLPPSTCIAGTCQAPGASGASCGDDEDCASGLGCSALDQACGVVAWASAGQPCGDLTRCLVGECSLLTNTCPAVIGDGQPCSPDDSTTTCDTLAQCTAGTCVLGDSVTCM